MFRPIFNNAAWKNKQVHWITIFVATAHCLQALLQLLIGILASVQACSLEGTLSTACFKKILNARTPDTILTPSPPGLPDTFWEKMPNHV